MSAEAPKSDTPIPTVIRLPSGYMLRLPLPSDYRRRRPEPVEITTHSDPVPVYLAPLPRTEYVVADFDEVRRHLTQHSLFAQYHSQWSNARAACMCAAVFWDAEDATSATFLASG